MGKFVYGRGGGGEEDEPRTAIEYPDTLRSKSYVKVIDLLGEGEFEEVLVGGQKGLLLDNTPVMNSDGTLNYTGLSIETRPGSLEQPRMKIGNTTESTVSVGVEMVYNSPVEVTISNVNVDVLRVNIKFPQLMSTSSTTGDIKGTEVKYKIEWKDSSSSVWNTVPSKDGTGQQRVKGKASSEYEKQTSFRVSGTAPWLVRCTRITADSTTSYLLNKTYFASVTSVLEEKLRYPGSVLVGMQVDAEQFSSIPTRSFLCKCLKIKVPTNYDPITRAYTGVWDGSFKIAWSDNPAWCFYDLLTNTRYGLGGRISESAIDKWELYSIAQYCDELVPGEDGVPEPRFSCNVVIQTRELAYQMISDFASIFRGISYWGLGTIVPVQDSPKEPSYAFNNTNVVDGMFTYQSSSLASRYNTVGVTWNNPNNFYKREVEYVEDTNLINTLGYVNQTDVVAFGCTSRAMARRVGKWLIYTNNYQTDVVSFQTGLEGVIPRPGDVIKISDTLRAQERRGGRIKSATLAGAVLDNPLAFTSGVVYTFTGINDEGELVETTFVYSGTTDTITFDTELASALAKNSIYIISDDNVEPQLFKVVSISDKGKSVYEINALSHDPAKYAYIEANAPLSDNRLTFGSRNAVEGINYTESLYLDNGTVKSRCDVSWKIPKFALRYIVRVIFPDGSVTTQTVSVSEYQLLAVYPGTYTISITSVNLFGQQAQTFTQSITLFGKVAPPQDVTGLGFVSVAGSANMYWDFHPDLDVASGGFIQINHSTKTTGATWSDSVEMAKVAGALSSTLVPLRGGTYLAKAVDSSGSYSVNAATVVSEYYNIIQNMNVVATLEEAPTFSGTKTNLTVVDGVMTLEAELYIDDAEEVDSYLMFDYLGAGVATTGEYLFSNIVDLGNTYGVNISNSISSSSAELYLTVDGRTDNIDTWPSFDALVPNTSTTLMYISMTNDDPLGTPTWTDWELFKTGVYTARAFRFKLYVETISENYTLYIDGLSVTVDVEDRVIGDNDITCPSTGLSVVFDPAFMATPAVAVLINDLQQGDYYEITSKSASGVTIIVKDSIGTAVDRVIDYIAKGYGYRV